MTYRPVPGALPKHPAGFFAAVATQNIFVEKRPNWLRRTFIPFPFVYMDYARPKESHWFHTGAIALMGVLMCCGQGAIGVALGGLWMATFALGCTGIFHHGLEAMDWEEAK